MTDSSCDAPIALGFLTVVAEPQHGLIGGYLLTSANARPLEFHCTVPIRANRAQEILYGPTLSPYLYGEQIAATLMKTSKLRPLAVFTDCEPALAAAGQIEMPLWLVLPSTDETADTPVPAATPTASSAAAATRGSVNGSLSSETLPGSTLHERIDAARGTSAGMTVARHGRNWLAQSVASAFAAKRLTSLKPGEGSGAGGAFDDRLAGIAATLDLSEPFDRIRAAIQEAQRGGR
jgi:hypothetical protein